MDGTPVEIVDVRAVGPDTVALTIETPPNVAARPGQFVQVRATVSGTDVTRHFSIPSPEVTDTFEPTVGVGPDGTLSPWLARATPGDTVEGDGPFGRVYYADEARVTILCAGPGIGPAVGIAERVHHDGGEATIVYRSDAPVHEARLARLASAGIRVFLAATAEAFTAAVAEAVPDGQLFVFGFEPFVETAEAAIVAAGGDAAGAKVENFG